MKLQILRISCLAAGLFAAAALMTNASGAPPETTGVAAQHQAGSTARITMRDGRVRIVKLEGVGCPQAMCSRKAIKAAPQDESAVSLWFDGLGAIRNTTNRDAEFVSKDGTSQRLSLLANFRVLYLAGPLGLSEKLDLGQVQSVEFVGQGK